MLLSLIDLCIAFLLNRELPIASPSPISNPDVVIALAVGVREEGFLLLLMIVS